MFWTGVFQLYLGIGVLFLSFLGYTFRRGFAGPLSHLPGPWYSRWTEWVLIYHWLKGQRATYVHGLHHTYGPVVRIAPDQADISDLAAKKQIYTVKETYKKSLWYSRITPPDMQNVFSTSDVEFHRRHRRLLAGALSETSLKALEPFIMRKVDLCIEKMGAEMDQRGAVDVFKWFMFLATDVIGELSFGESFQMLEKGKKNNYIENLERTALVMALLPHFQWLLALGFSMPFTIPGLSDVAKVAPEIRKYGDESLQRYKRQVEADPYNVKPSLFTKMFLAKEEDKLSFDEVRADASLYIIAGSDTSSNTLSYLVWELTRDLNIRDALVKELQGVPRDFTHEHVCDLPYLNMVIEEALRLHALIPGLLPRVVPKEGAGLAGYWFPGGAAVSCQAYSLHRDPIIYPDPERFDPNRWAQPTKEMKDAFMAFGGGSRICIGIHLARMELRLATAKFFKTFPNAMPTSLEGMSDEDMDPDVYFLSNPRGKRCLIQAR